MKKFSRSKNYCNNNFLINNKCYLIFIFFNINLSIINVLKLTIEDNLGFKISKIKTNLNVSQVCLEINFKDYLENKEDLVDFFLKEDFKFYLASVYYKNNHMIPSFFEDEFLQNVETAEFYEEILHFNYINILINQIEKKKIVFFFYNVFILNKTLINFNVYNTSSSV